MTIHYDIFDLIVIGIVTLGMLILLLVSCIKRLK